MRAGEAADQPGSLEAVQAARDAGSVPPGCTDPAVSAAGGNPYGTSLATGSGLEEVPATALAAAPHQGARLADHAALLARTPLPA